LEQAVENSPECQDEQQNIFRAVATILDSGAPLELLEFRRKLASETMR